MWPPQWQLSALSWSSWRGIGVRLTFNTFSFYTQLFAVEINKRCLIVRLTVSKCSPPFLFPNWYYFTWPLSVKQKQLQIVFTKDHDDRKTRIPLIPISWSLCDDGRCPQAPVSCFVTYDLVFLSLTFCRRDYFGPPGELDQSHRQAGGGRFLCGRVVRRRTLPSVHQPHVAGASSESDTRTKPKCLLRRHWYQKKNTPSL